MGKRVGLLGLLLALALGSGAMAQSASPSNPIAELHRVEVPEAGLAIGHPDAWVAIPEVDAVNEVVTSVMTLTSLDRGTCGLLEIKHPGVTSTIDFIEDEFIPGFWFAQPDFPGGYTATRLTFPVGQVLRVSFDEVRVDLDGTEFHNVNHFYPAPDGTVALLCSARSELGLAPEADWVAMARSLEFLPESVSGASSPSRPLAGGRIERPGDGFAVVFPDGWEVTDLPAAFSQGPEVEEGGRGRVRYLLLASDPYTDAICTLVDFTEVATASPPWASVDAAVAARRAVVTEEPGAGAPTTTFIDLPAGRAGRLDVTFGQDRNTSRWYFSDGAAWFSLSCETSAPPPHDRWLSIAETFEFLPVKPTPAATDG